MRRASAWRQLCWLFWRNALIKWRGGSVTAMKFTIPVFQIVETVTPFTVFITLVIVRSSFEAPEDVLDSKFQAHALPSAGTLPFLQSLVCGYNRKAYPGPLSDMPTFPNATINMLYAGAGDYSLWRDNWNEIRESIDILKQNKACLDHMIVLENAGCFESDIDMMPIECFLQNITEFREHLEKNLTLNWKIVNGIIGAKLKSSKVLPLLSLLPSYQGSVEDSQGLREKFHKLSPNLIINFACISENIWKNVDFLEINASEVKKTICHLPGHHLLSLFQEMKMQLAPPCNQTELSQSISRILDLQPLLGQSRMLQFMGTFFQVAEENSKQSSGDNSCESELDSSYRYFCGTVMDGNHWEIEKMWRQYCQEAGTGKLNVTQGSDQRKISPKIFYTPHTNSTVSIIQKANRTFESIEKLMTLARRVADTSQYFLESYQENSTFVKAVKKFLNLLLEHNEKMKPIQISSILSALSKNISLDALKKANGLFNTSEQQNIWEVMNIAVNVSTTIHNFLKRLNLDIFLPIKDETELEDIANNLIKNWEDSNLIAGVVFDNLDFDHTTLTKIGKVRIRTDPHATPKTQKSFSWYPGPEDKNSIPALYAENFFIYVQDLIERALTEEIVGERVPTPGVYLQEMPYPCFRNDRFYISLVIFMPLCLVYAWLIPQAMIARDTVWEKQSKQKEFMKMVGIKGSLQRLSWFLYWSMTLLLMSAGMTVVLKTSGLLPYSNWFLIFAFFAAYSFVGVSYSFLISALFNKANIAACASAGISFFVSVAVGVIVPNQNSFGSLFLGACCLWAPLAFALGVLVIVQWELRQVGIIFDNVTTLPVEDSHLSFLPILAIMLCDGLFYTLITWYIEEVFPGQYGVAKPWYFPCLPSYWWGKEKFPDDRLWKLARLRVSKQENAQEDQQELLCMTDVSLLKEEVSGSKQEDLQIGISVENLSKTFTTGFRLQGRKKTTVVNSISLCAYEDQITVILGHNGAGKTTLMSMLTGLFEPSGGTAYIYSNSIQTQMDQIHQNLGVCPQQDILLDNLTVEEHLHFYGKHRGLEKSQLKNHIPKWLKKLDLLVHAQKCTKHLSGGMKRKLSILLAFLGNPKAIILDEPTAKVDPLSRKHIWDFILQHKKGRTILLSTHHMDEVEALGDKIAIISKGSLLCCGTLDYLKQRFGRDHYLTVKRNCDPPSLQEDGLAEISLFPEVEESSFDDTEITGLVKSVVSQATLWKSQDGVLEYRLPLLQVQPSILAHLFAELENKKHVLGVASYNINSSNMEEIFLKLTGQELSEDETSQEHYQHKGTSTNNHSGNRNHSLAHGNLWTTHFYALLVKRIHYARGKASLLIPQTLLALLIITAGQVGSTVVQNFPDAPSFALSPSLFFANSRYNYLFAGGYYTNETSLMINSLFQPCGVAAPPTDEDIATKCHPEVATPLWCSDANYLKQQYSCSCPSCENDSIDQSFFQPAPPPCYNGTVSGSRVQNLSLDYDPLHPDLGYTTLHEYLLRSTDSFVEHRYGGVSFGHFRQEVDASVDDINTNPDSLPFLATHSAAKVWFSPKGYHSMPAYLNTMNNAILRGTLSKLFQEKEPVYAGIHTSSHPFKLPEKRRKQVAVRQNPVLVVNPLSTTFALGLVVAIFVVVPTEERVNKSKHLQMMCGLSKVVYWLGTYFWDLLWFCGVFLLTLSLYLLLGDSDYTGSVTSVFVVIVLSYALAAIPWMYIWSFYFASPSTAYVSLVILNFFSGLIFIIPYIFHNNLQRNYVYRRPSYSLVWIPFPAYSLTRSLMYLSFDRILKDNSISNQYWDLLPFILSLLVQSCIYSSIVFLIEVSPFFTSKLSCKRNFFLPSLKKEALSEEHPKGNRNGDVLVLNDLTKIYGNFKPTIAVNQLCLTVKKGECFGLLGANGAGKTTTFRMLTGDISVTSGKAIIASNFIEPGRMGVHHSVGYCPQVDALIEPLTGRQHLTFYSRLQGISASHVKETVEWALTKLELREHADKPVKSYSGGNKRKLSIAISLLASPPLILMDEPTAGLDSHSRRFLWKVLKEVISNGQSVCMTTHSMVECEALCSRVGIMVNGSLHCLGTPQQLKSTYGHGYLLKIKTVGSVKNIKELMSQNMSSATVKEEYHNLIVYELPSTGLQLSKVYEIMESAKKHLNIKNYSLTQTTLEDVFISAYEHSA